MGKRIEGGYQAFSAGLEKRFGRSEVEHFKYIGASEGPGAAYMITNQIDTTTLPLESKCVCGHDIIVNCYLRHIPTEEIVVVGTKCVRQFLPTGLRRTCAQCNKVHRNCDVDLCCLCSKTCDTRFCKTKVSLRTEFCRLCAIDRATEIQEREDRRAEDERRTIAMDVLRRAAEATQRILHEEQAVAGAAHQEEQAAAVEKARRENEAETSAWVVLCDLREAEVAVYQAANQAKAAEEAAAYLVRRREFDQEQLAQKKRNRKRPRDQTGAGQPRITNFFGKSLSD